MIYLTQQRLETRGVQWKKLFLLKNKNRFTFLISDNQAHRPTDQKSFKGKKTVKNQLIFPILGTSMI
jgi:hypothetical protein